MLRRVFYFSGYRMKVFEWQGVRLLGSAEFEPDEEGICEFDEYLSQATRVPSQLLVDLVEEDFRREVIPHVNANDRKAIISRLLDRHYRGEVYVHVQPQGRSKDGRKDDNLLLSALINKDVLEPWLGLIQKHKIPLAGIWSLPLLSTKLLAAITLNEKNVIAKNTELKNTTSKSDSPKTDAPKKEANKTAPRKETSKNVMPKNVMIVSQQTSTAQRESYFIDGNLMLSRQEKLDRDRRDRRNDHEGDERRSENQQQDRRQRDLKEASDTNSQASELDRRIQSERRSTEDRRDTDRRNEEDSREDSGAANAALSIKKGAEQIHIFLTNQRIMGFTEKLHVYCILSGAELEETRQRIQDTNAIQYQFVNLHELFTHYKLHNCDDQEADALFAYLCASTPLAPDHYAQTKEKQAYYRYRLNRAISVATILGSLITFIGAALLWLNSFELRQEQQATDNQRIILERRYQNDFVPIQQRLTDAPSVQASVELARRIQREAQLSPERLFTPLSTVFSDTRFASLQLDGFSWKKYPQAEVVQLLQTQNASVSEPLTELELQALPAEPEVPATASLQPVLTIDGYLLRGDRSYQETVALMNAFAEALRKLPGVKQVVVLKMPVDVRPALVFMDDLGVQKEVKQNVKEANQYEIIIAFNAEEPALE